MNTKTEIATDYAPFRKTKSGKWRKLEPFWFYRSEKLAKMELEKIKEADKIARFPSEAPSEYKIMKRTVITTISEWEDLESTKKECEEE